MDINNWININNVLVVVFGYPLSYIEFIGTLTGLFSVWFSVKSNILTWPIGLINVAAFFIVFFQVHLYSDMFLQVYFFLTSLYGWILWNKINKEKSNTIKHLSSDSQIILGILIFLSTLLVGLVIKNLHLLLPSIFTAPASYPFTDTFVSVMSIVATVLLAQKRIENWILWILVDIISIFLYAKKHVIFISIEYMIFLLLAVAGLLSWVKILQNEKRLSIR